MKTDLEKYFNSIGEKGSIERLEAIACAGLGERSEAAQRVIQKRKRIFNLTKQYGNFKTSI